MRRLFTLAIAATAAIATPVSAQKTKKEDQARPSAFAKLIECRSIPDSAARLACYDAEAATLDEAERNSDVLVVDRQQIKKARRSLFGLSLPSIGGMFGRDNDKAAAEEEITSIESTIKLVTTTRVGKLVIVIDDGARWVQIDTTSIRTPKVGQSVRIRKAALGSYFVSINDNASIRMKREN